MSKKRAVFFFLTPILLSFLLHFPILNLDVVGYHVWRQTQTQTVIYNFSFADNSILNPQKFDLSNGTSQLLYEFPLYQWLIAQVNNLFGYSVLHTRLMGFVFLTFLMAGFYLLLRKFVSREVALLTNFCLSFSPVLYYYCANPLPDVFALGLGVWAMNLFFDFLNRKNVFVFVLFCITLSLATLVKLPYLMFGSGFLLFLYKELKKEKGGKSILYLLILAFSLLPAATWYLKAIPTWGINPVGLGMSANNKSLFDLLDYFQSNLISSMPELITNYGACLFLFTGFYLFFSRKKWRNGTNDYFVFIFAFCCFYFFYEINLIGKTHDYYLLPFVPFIFFVVATGINYLYFTKYKKATLVLVCLVVPLLAYLRINHRWNVEEPGFNKNFIVHHKKLQSLLPESATCIVDFDESRFIALYYLKRRGFTLYENEISLAKIEEFYSKGAKYLVTLNKSFPTEEYAGLRFEELYSDGIKMYSIKRK